MGAFPYPFNTRMPDVSDALLGALAANFRSAATQAELDAHKASSDHDGRYYTESEADALLAAKAALASPTFTGVPAAPTAAQGTNTTQLATTEFVQTASGLLIPKSIGDAKGDLIGFSAADTPVRIPAASGDGYALISDTSQPGGVKWRKGARIRWSMGPCLFPSGTGDFVQGFNTSGANAFVPVAGSYPATGMLTIAALDLLAGGAEWKARAFYEILAGDSRSLYTVIFGANASGTYGITSIANVSTPGIYAEGTESGTLSNPRTVGGSGHRMYSYVGSWADRADFVSSGRAMFGAYAGVVSSIASIGWFGKSGIEIELL